MESDCDASPTSLSRLEQGVFHQLVEQRADAAALCFGAAHHVVQRLTIGEGDVAAGGVDRQLLGEVAQEGVRIGGEHGLKLGDAAELAAVGKLTGGIDGGPELEGDADKGVDVSARGGIALIADAAVAGAKRSDDVERFKGE